MLLCLSFTTQKSIFRCLYASAVDVLVFMLHVLSLSGWGPLFFDEYTTFWLDWWCFLYIMPVLFPALNMSLVLRAGVLKPRNFVHFLLTFWILWLIWARSMWLFVLAPYSLLKRLWSMYPVCSLFPFGLKVYSNGIALIFFVYLSVLVNGLLYDFTPLIVFPMIYFYNLFRHCLNKVQIRKKCR